MAKPLFLNKAEEEEFISNLARNLVIEMESLKRAASENADVPNKISKTDQDNTQNNDILPAALPKELTAMFKPLECQLCKAPASSPLSAASHYAGKPHQRKVNQYLAAHHPELLPKVQVSQKKGTAGTEDTKFVCTLCNMNFSSEVVQQQHLLGKKHKHRMHQGPKITPVEGMDSVDETGRYGIGSDFVEKQIVKPKVSTKPPITNPDRNLVGDKTQKWYCDICEVSATDSVAYQFHKAGKKHQKNCKKSGLIDEQPKIIDLQKAQDEAVTAKTKKHGTYENNRTPSGDYYCQKCDVTMNSVGQFESHIESKKHKRKI